MSVSEMAVTVTLAKAVPNTSAAFPSLTANTNVANTPPAFGSYSQPATPAGTVNTNTGRTTMATQTFLSPMTFDGPQQGTNATTNVTSITLAGYPIGGTQFYQFTGAYQKA